MREIVRLSEATDPARFGHKAAALGRALNAGLLVPQGLAVSSLATEALVRRDPEIVRQLARLLKGSIGLAVRSSGLFEDGEKATFAGMHMTRLNVRGLDEILRAVDEIRASTTRSEVRDYTERLGVPATSEIGVIIQEMVPADVAGVLFSIDPTNGSDVITIDASLGLGIAVVDGSVIPDQFMIDRTSGEVTARPGNKSLLYIEADSGGVRQVDLGQDRASKICLNDGQIRDLVELTSRCDALFEGPHDLEWAFVDSRLFLLQRRLITTNVPNL